MKKGITPADTPTDISQATATATNPVTKARIHHVGNQWVDGAGKPVQSAAPVVTHPDQLPPPAQRKVGMTINIPGRGEVTWNGQGWVAAVN